jgi:O-antigen/teichoic acid export membrane protein
MSRLLERLRAERDKNSVIKWNFIFYIATFLYTILIGVVLVPLYLKYIPREIYGYWLATGNVLNLLTIIDPGFSSVVQQKVSLYYGKKNTHRIGAYSFMGLVICILFVSIIMIGGFILQSMLPSIFPEIHGSDLVAIKEAFFYALMGTSMMLVYYILGAIDYGLLSSKGIGSINALGNLSSFLSIFFFLSMGYGVVALGMALFIRGMVYLGLSILYTFLRFRAEKIRFSFDRLILKDFISLIGINFLGKIGLSAVNQINSFVCTRYVNPLATPTLKFTQTVPDFCKIVLIRIANSIAPVIPNLNGQGKNRPIELLVSKMVYIMIWMLGMLSIGLYLFNGSFMALWVSTSYYGGDSLNILIICMLLLTTISEIFSLVIFSLGEIKKNSMILFIQSLLYVPLVIYLANKYGIHGILIAGIIVQILLTAWYFPTRYLSILKIPGKQILPFIKEILRVALIILAMVVLFRFININTVEGWIGLFRGIVICMATYFIFLYFISRRFQETVCKYWRRIF